MAKKQTVGERAIAYLMSPPVAPPSEITLATALAELAALHEKLSEAIDAQKAAAETAPPLEKPADTLTLDQLRKVAQAIKRIRPRGTTTSQNP